MEDRQVLDSEVADVEEHVARIAADFRGGFEAVARIDRPAVTIFGSARTPAGTKPYEEARDVARRFAEAGWAVVTGGGPGVMEAANRGAKEAAGSRSASTSSSRTSSTRTRTSTSRTRSSTSTPARRCS